jgi:predicted GNAT family N-acyltransferase
MLRTPHRASVDKYGYEWRVERPVHPGSPSSRPVNEWLAELWDMRGRIIYQNGYRPSFRSPDGKFSDEDCLDAFSFHVTARLNGKLVGCVRLVRYIDAPTTWAQSALGKAEIEKVVNSLESSLEDAGECGRWIVEPKERGKHLGRYLMSGVYATARAFNVKVLLGLSGTHERQDLAFMSMGWKRVEGFPVIPAPKFNDDLRFISFDVGKMSRREIEMSHILGSLLGFHKANTFAGTSSESVTSRFSITGTAI